MNEGINYQGNSIISMDVGPDTGLRVTEDEPKGQFTGEIRWVQLDLGIEDYDHFLTPEERYRAAMMRQ